MLNKKTSNILSILVMLWVGAVALLFMWKHSLLPASYGAPIAWAFLVAMFFMPMLVVYVNSRTPKDELTLLDQILQFVFHLSWLGLGLIFVFANGNSSLLNSVLSFSLVLVALILLKSFVAPRPKK